MLFRSANPRLIREVPEIKSALLAFSPQMPEGKQFFEATSYQDMRAITAEDMKSFDSYTVYLKQQLGQ